jgi:hypothetical protein
MNLDTYFRIGHWLPNGLVSPLDASLSAMAMHAV